MLQSIVDKVHVSCVGSIFLSYVTNQREQSEGLEMVSSVSSINKYPIVNYEELEVVRRLQSLGVAPSGNLAVDRQNLQVAELQKKQMTLASNSEVNLNRIAGSGRDFSATIKNIAKSDVLNDSIGQETGLNNVNGLNSSSESVRLQYEMKGANQIAELNKFRLGLIA